MNDLKDLLALALDDGHGPGPAVRPDPAGDLARGRRLLRRRRLAGVTATAAAAAVAAGVVPLLISNGTSGPAGGAQAGSTQQASAPAAGPRGAPIALVAYDGQQPAGYQVAEMPAGWAVQGGNAYALTIAPRSDTNSDPSVFVGKIVVMLQSTDAPAPPTQGAVVAVSGRPGRLTVQDHTQVLIYRDTHGHWVVIQAPTSLGWDDTRLAQFAAGVQVLHNARPGHG